MRRRTFTAGALALAATPLVARAQQQPIRVPRLAYLSLNPPGDRWFQAMLAGLRDFGYIDGRNIAVEDLSAPSVADLPSFVARAVAAKPDILVAYGDPSARLAKGLTSTVPIVFVAVASPVEAGLVASLNRPGGNVTGHANFNDVLAAKRLQFLKEMVPGLVRVAILILRETPGQEIELREMMAAAKSLGLEASVVEVRRGEDFKSLFVRAVANGAQAIQFASGVYFGTNAARLAELATKFHMPTGSTSRRLPEAGALMSYGGDPEASVRRVAYYVDRILKGAKPADLPVEQPREFEFVINRKTAKALGLAIPEHLLVFATGVIE